MHAASEGPIIDHAAELDRGMSVVYHAELDGGNGKRTDDGESVSLTCTSVTDEWVSVVFAQFDSSSDVHVKMSDKFGNLRWYPDCDHQLLEERVVESVKEFCVVGGDNAQFSSSE